VNAIATHQIDSDQTRIVAPGDLADSSLYVRLAGMGPLHMPPLGTFVANTQVVALVAAWITNDLPARLPYAQWATNQFGPNNVPWLGAPDQDADGDGLTNELEYQLGTSPVERTDSWRPTVRVASGGVRLQFVRKANRSFVVETTTDLDAAEIQDWTPADIPENRVYFPAKDEPAEVRIPAGEDMRLYRIRIVVP
jgi:hypothetical protein